MESTGTFERVRDRSRRVAAARLAMGLACLAAQLARGGLESSAPLTAAGALFVLYAGVTLRIAGRMGAPAALLTLILDTAYFLFFTAYGRDSGAWISSAFYAFLLLSTLASHHWRETCVVVGATGLFLAAADVPGRHELARLVLWSAVLACPAAVYQRHLERRMEEAIGQVRAQEAAARKAEESVRHKLAGDFHDGPLQVFIALQMRLEVLARLMERNLPEALKEVHELQALTKAQINELRAFLRGIRPVEVAHGGLGESLRAMVAEFQKNSGIRAVFEADGSPELPAPEKSAEVIQIVREALSNVQKHSRATQVAVGLKAAGNSVEVSVEDNGTGFPFSGTFDLEEMEQLGIGPYSIRKRVEALKGGMILESRPQLGSSIRVRIPA